MLQVVPQPHTFNPLEGKGGQDDSDTGSYNGKSPVASNSVISHVAPLSCSYKCVRNIQRLRNLNFLASSSRSRSSDAGQDRTFFLVSNLQCGIFVGERL